MIDILIAAVGLMLLLCLLAAAIEHGIEQQRRRKMSGYEIEQRMRWHASQQARIDRGEVQGWSVERREAREDSEWRRV